MAVLGGGSMLSACGDGAVAPQAAAVEPGNLTEVQVYENVFACVKITGKTRAECDDLRTQAFARAKDEAPRFAALSDCEESFGEGQCIENGIGELEENAAGEQEQARSGHRHYSPFVVAWFSSSKSSNSVPLFKNKAGGYQAANGTRLSFTGSPGKYHASARAMERAKTVAKVKPASKLAKAGGFGSRGSSWSVSDRDGRAKAGDSSSSRSKGG